MTQALLKKQLGQMPKNPSGGEESAGAMAGNQGAKSVCIIKQIPDGCKRQRSAVLRVFNSTAVELKTRSCSPHFRPEEDDTLFFTERRRPILEYLIKTIPK